MLHPPLSPLDFNSGVRRGRKRGASSISGGLLAWYSRLLMTACNSESCHLNRQLRWKYFGFRHKSNPPIGSFQIHLKPAVLKWTGKLPVVIINILSKQKPKCKRNMKLFKKYFSFCLGRKQHISKILFKIWATTNHSVYLCLDLDNGCQVTEGWSHSNT